MAGAAFFIVIQLLLLIFLYHSWTDKLAARVHNGGSSLCWYGGNCLGVLYVVNFISKPCECQTELQIFVGDHHYTVGLALYAFIGDSVSFILHIIFSPVCFMLMHRYCLLTKPCEEAHPIVQQNNICSS